MRILMMQFQGGGVGHYRLTIPARGLKALDIDVCDADGTFSKNLAELEKYLVKNCREYDLIHTSYLNDSEAIRLLLSGRNYGECPIVVDIDDDLYNVPSYNVAYRAYHGGAAERRIARLFLRVSDAASVSTDALVPVLGRDCNVMATLPNCIDVADWQNPVDPERARDESVRIMFSGNLGRYGDLAEVREALDRVLTHHPNVRLFFIGCAPDWSTKWAPSTTDPTANRCFYIRPCNVQHYASILQWISPDILINPVQRNKFNKSKSHIKAFDAAMSGAAFVCTDWQTHAEVPAGCAFKVDNKTTQWEETLNALVVDSALRKRSNTRLKQWVLDTQTIDKHVHKWIQLYEQVIKKGPITDISQVVRPGVGGGDGVAKQQEGVNTGPDGDEALAHVRSG